MDLFIYLLIYLLLGFLFNHLENSLMCMFWYGNFEVGPYKPHS